MRALLDRLGVERFSLITHDRGTPPGDYLVAALGERVIRYGRGQQHLWHLHPSPHPQELMFTSGHFSPFEAPAEMVQVLREFLGSTPSSLR